MTRPGTPCRDHLSVDDVEITRIDFPHVGGKLQDPVAHQTRGTHHRPAGQRRRAGSTGADEIERRDLGVATHDAHLADVDSDRIGNQLGKRGFMALTVGLLAGEYGDRAVRLNANVRLLRRSGHRGEANSRAPGWA